MKRRYRLRDQERFRQVRQEGASVAHPLMVLCVLPNHLAVSRCGFSVSRRVGGAVERNRARRRMAEAVRTYWDLVEPGWDMVWIARPAIGGSSFADLLLACAHLLRRAGAIRRETPKRLEVPSGKMRRCSELPERRAELAQIEAVPGRVEDGAGADDSDEAQ